MNFTIYNTATGQIIQSGICSDISIQAIPDGCSLLEIKSDALNQYIDNGQLVNIPARPSNQHEFDYLSKSWVINIELLKEVVIAQRSNLLFKSDWTQLPNSPLTQQQQEQWATYRQALRDITAQSGYPANVIWPTKPTE
jgi:hypothetical protein